MANGKVKHIDKNGTPIKRSNFEEEYRKFVSNVITDKNFIKFLESTINKDFKKTDNI